MKRRILKKAVVGALLFVLAAALSLAAFLALTLPDVSDLKTRDPASTALIRQRQAEARRKGRELTVRREPVSLSAIPRLLQDAVRVTEDVSFYWHKGVDYGELREALRRDLREGRFARGASTITQQLAKNLYLSTDKNLVRKLRELLIARQLEKALSKDRIFQLYLNSIELGPGVFGVQAASRHYFGRDVGSLSPGQIIRLTAVIPRPLTCDPRGEGGWFLWRCGHVFGKLKLHGIITEEEFRSLEGEF